MITGLLLVIRGLIVSVTPTPKRHVVHIMTFDDTDPSDGNAFDSLDEWPSLICVEPRPGHLTVRDPGISIPTEAARAFG